MKKFKKFADVTLRYAVFPVIIACVALIAAGIHICITPSSQISLLVCEVSCVMGVIGLVALYVAIIGNIVIEFRNKQREEAFDDEKASD